MRVMDQNGYECKIERDLKYRTVFGAHEVWRQLFYGEVMRVVPTVQAGNLPERLYPVELAS